MDTSVWGATCVRTNTRFNKALDTHGYIGLGGNLRAHKHTF